jgi:hypothetical protein
MQLGVFSEEERNSKLSANEDEFVLQNGTSYSVKAVCESLDVLPQTDTPHALDVLLSD